MTTVVHDGTPSYTNPFSALLLDLFLTFLLPATFATIVKTVTINTMMAAIVGTYTSSAFVHKPRSLSLTKITFFCRPFSSTIVSFQGHVAFGPPITQQFAVSKLLKSTQTPFPLKSRRVRLISCVKKEFSRAVLGAANWYGSSQAWSAKLYEIW